MRRQGTVPRRFIALGLAAMLAAIGCTTVRTPPAPGPGQPPLPPEPPAVPPGGAPIPGVPPAGTPGPAAPQPGAPRPPGPRVGPEDGDESASAGARPEAGWSVASIASPAGVPADDPRLVDPPPADPPAAGRAAVAATSGGGWAADPVVDLALEPASPAAGSAVTIAVRMSGARGVRGAPFHLRYPAGVLRFEFASAGSLFEGSNVVFMANGPPGSLFIALSRFGGAATARSDGTLCILNFSALRPGTATLTFEDAHVFLAGPGDAAATFRGSTFTVR